MNWLFATWIAVLLGLAVLFFGAFGAPGILFWLTAAGVASMAWSEFRESRREALLRLVALAAERQIPLVPLVSAFQDETGWRRLGKFTARLESGQSLAAAAQATGRILPEHAYVALMAGEQTGALATALTDAAAGRRAQQALWTQVGEKGLYLALVMLFAINIIVFQMIKIVPSLARIFEDFNTELPAMTQRVIDWSAWLAVSGLAGALVLVCMTGMLLLAMHYMGWIRLRIPLFGRLTDGLEFATVLRALALATGRDESLIQVLTRLAKHHPRYFMRSRLWRVVRDINDGRNWIDSLRAKRLVGHAEAGVLHSSERVGNTPWALRHMAESMERRVLYRLRTLSQVLFPLAILAIGGVVFFYVVGLFLPLVKLITALT